MMSRRLPRVSVIAIGVVLLTATSVGADWWDIHQADTAFDLPTARRLALQTVAEDPTGADGVAAAGWWLHRMRNLRDPEEILTAVPAERDPELGFLLALIEAELNGRPPRGTVTTAELVGPYGVFDALDIERGIAPPDSDLPPPATGFEEQWKPVRFTLSPLDGILTPPEVLTPRGVFVGLWTVQLEKAFDGWVALQAVGSYNLYLDDLEVDRRRDSGRLDAEVGWYRVRLDPGLHRIRADMAAHGRPELRVVFIGADGQPQSIPTAAVGTAGPWAAAKIEAADPPAAAALENELEGGGSVSRLLTAAALGEYRGDLERWRRWLETASEDHPDDPWPHLALARFWATAPVIDDAETIRRRAREQLRLASEIPIALYYEYRLAFREQRREDEERFLEELVDRHGNDVRVVGRWISEALQRGWVREAENGLKQLQAALPASRHASEVALEVFEVLERWQERHQLLRALALTEPLDRRLVGELAAGCLVDDAVQLVTRLRQRAVDPDLDVELVQLHYTAGDLEAAEEELAAVRARWGALRVADELALAVTAHDEESHARALDDALDRSPSAVQLLTLAWRRGRPAFYEPYQRSLDEVKARDDVTADEVDAVLLLDQAVERVFSDGSSLYYYHGVTRAITPVGAQQAARLQQLPNSHRLKVRIHKPDGTIVVPSEIGDSGNFLELGEVDPGDLVEEEYVAVVAPTGTSRRGHLPPYIYRFADPDRAFGLSEYYLLVPPEIELLVEGNFDGLERSEEIVDGLRVIRWHAEGVPPIPDERFAPPPGELLPWVSYGFGVTWQDVGDAVRDRLMPLFRTTPELDAWSAPILAADDPEEALTSLVNAVIDEVEPGRGVLDFSNTAGSSFSRRRSNRLGIVAAILLSNGWEVDLVMGRTRPFAGTHLLVPTFDSFGLPLLRVERDGVERWLDLEEERGGIGRIDPFLQGSDGLLVPLSRPNEPVRILAELPTFANPDLEEKVSVEAVVEATGDAQLTVRLPIRGPQAERVIEQIRSVPTERVPLVYQQMAANFVPSAADVNGRIDRVDGGIDLELDMHAPKVCQVDGDSMVCRGLIFTKPLAPVLAALPTRRYPLIMPVPVLQRNELVLEMPDGWTIDHRARRIETRWGSVIETVEQDGQRHHSVLRLELPAQTVSPEDYVEFTRFCHAVDELNSRPPVLTLR
jgi:hypothetical protein